MSFFSFFGRSSGNGTTSECELPSIYPLSLTDAVFIEADIKATYTKILTDTLERTHGIPDKVEPLLWDNCLQNEASEGLITLLVCAMVKQSDLYMVWNKATNVLRLATAEESRQIRADYEKTGESKIGVYVSFKNYRRTEMLRIYSALEYCILSSLHKTVNISKAVQIKMADLRSSVSLADSGIAATQARSLAAALKAGKDVLLDAKDNITTATPNTDPTEKAISFLDAKRAFYLGLPISYISGEQTAGIGSTGEADMRAVERGLKQYFFSIIHPALFALFGIDTDFESEDFRQMATALEVLKTFELVSDEVLSKESKRAIVARVFGLDAAEEEKQIAAEEAQRAKDAKANPQLPTAPTPGATNDKGAVA